MNHRRPLLRRLCARLGMSIALSLPVALHAQHDPIHAPIAGDLPAAELTAETLYQFLLAEIAGARGHLDVSVQAYLALSRRTLDPRIARRAAEIALYARNFPAAAEAARLWNIADPSSEEARRLLTGMLAGGGGDLEDVHAHLARVLADSPERLGVNLMALNRSLARVEDKQLVLETVERLTEPYLEHPEAHYARAQAAAIAQDNDEALAAIDNALDLHPDWEPGMMLKAQLLQQSGDEAGALTLMSGFLQRHPDSRNGRQTYARLLVGQQQFEAARAQFEQLLTASPDDAELLYAIGLLSAQMEDDAHAQIHFERALAAGHPEADTIRLNLAQIFEKRADLDAALAQYRQIGDGEHGLQARMRAAQLLVRHQRMDEARAQLRNPEAEPEQRKRLLLAEAQLLRDAGQPGTAFELLDEALREAPDDTDLLYESAMLAERLDQLDAMEARLRKLIALEPDNAHAYNALGYSLADRGLRLEEAEALIVRALELLPDDPFILDSMGWVRFRRGAAADALTHLERAYALRTDPEIAAHLGEVLWALERHDEADEIWANALKDNPGHRVLLQTMERLRP